MCKSNHDIINYSTAICPFESGKCGKEGKKSQKFEYLENENSFLNQTKKFSTVLKRLSFGERIKIWQRTDVIFQTNRNKNSRLKKNMQRDNMLKINIKNSGKPSDFVKTLPKNIKNTSFDLIFKKFSSSYIPITTLINPLLVVR